MDPDSVPEIGRVPHGGTEQDTLDFSTNTNPQVPEGIPGVYQEALSVSRSYPADGYPSYRAAAGEYVGADPEQVIPTPGGLAAIRLTVATTVTPGDLVAVPVPSFGEYAREVRLQGGEPVFVEAADLLRIDPGEYALVIACNPNNPTGHAYDPQSLREFVTRCRDVETPFLIDEAFLGFTESPSFAGLDGVIVARSLTKLFGLPGLRMGFAVATGGLLDILARARRTWNLGAPAAAVGAYCMRQTGFVQQTRRRVTEERQRMQEALSGRFDLHPSEAPFLLLDVGDRQVGQIIGRLRRQGITIRDATTFRRLDSHVRVAVRLPEENDRLLEALNV